MISSADLIFGIAAVLALLLLIFGVLFMNPKYNVVEKTVIDNRKVIEQAGLCRKESA